MNKNIRGLQATLITMDEVSFMNSSDNSNNNGSKALKLSVKRLKTKVRGGNDAWTSVNQPQSSQMPGNQSGWTALRAE
jgi:hypothetical protein